MSDSGDKAESATIDGSPDQTVSFDTEPEVQVAEYLKGFDAQNLPHDLFGLSQQFLDERANISIGPIIQQWVDELYADDAWAKISSNNAEMRTVAKFLKALQSIKTETALAKSVDFDSPEMKAIIKLKKALQLAALAVVTDPDSPEMKIVAELNGALQSVDFKDMSKKDMRTLINDLASNPEFARAILSIDAQVNLLTVTGAEVNGFEAKAVLTRTLRSAGITSSWGMKSPPNERATPHHDIRMLCCYLVGQVVSVGLSSPWEEKADNSDNRGEFSFGFEEVDTATLSVPELPDVEPIQIVKNVGAYLNGKSCAEQYGLAFDVKTPKLYDVRPKLRENRGKAELKKDALVYFLERFGEFKDGKDYYDKVFITGLYDSFYILLENVATLFLGDEYLQQLENNQKSPYLFATIYLLSRMKKDEKNGQFRVVTKQESETDYKGVFLECAAGTCSIAKRLSDAYDGLKLHIRMEQDRRQRPTIESIRKQANADATRVWRRLNGKKSTTKRILAIDNYAAFPSLTAQKNVTGIEADLCLPNEEFLKATGLKPGSVDTMTLILAIDRLPDFEQAMANIRCLARENGSSKILVGFYLPLDNVVSTKSKNPNVKNIEFFNAEDDIRRRWMKDFDGTLLGDESVTEGIDDDNMMEARMLTDFFIVMKRDFGMDLMSFGSQPFEIVSPHCVIEKVGVIRKNYTKEDLQCGEPEIDGILEDVFAENSTVDDDEVIILPERIERLYTCAFRIEK